MGGNCPHPSAHVFVAGDLTASGAVRLREADFRHLGRALRLRPGEMVSVANGSGWSRPFFWTGTPSLEPAGDAAFEPAPWPAITVAFALTKGLHPEWAVQKLTEAGVDRIVVMTTARCVARWPGTEAPRRLARLQEVARQAAMQSRRSWLPAVEGPLSFAQVLGVGTGVPQGAGTGGMPEGVGGAGRAAEHVGPSAGGPTVASPPPQLGTPGIALAVPGGAPLSLATPTVLVGPEGGWEPGELSSVPCHVGLGPHVLRAETAAVAAGVLLAALRAHLVEEARG